MDNETITFTEAAASVISAVVAVLAVGLGGFLQWWMGKRQLELARIQVDQSALLAREQMRQAESAAREEMLRAAEVARYQTIAPMRQRWINKLRSRIAVFIAISADLHMRIIKDSETIDSTFLRELFTVEEEIYLLLHKGEASHDAIAQAVNKIRELAVREHVEIAKLHTAHQILRIITQGVLKEEWEVTKKMDAKIEAR